MQQPIWERFVACKSLKQHQTFQTSQSSGGSGILGARSLNLSSSSISLNASSAALMREFTVQPVADLLSEKALQELANRNRLVDYLRVCLANRTRDATGHARVQGIAVAGIKVIRSIHVSIVFIEEDASTGFSRRVCSIRMCSRRCSHPRMYGRTCSGEMRRTNSHPSARSPACLRCFHVAGQRRFMCIPPMPDNPHSPCE